MCYIFSILMVIVIEKSCDSIYDICIIYIYKIFNIIFILKFCETCDLYLDYFQQSLLKDTVTHFCVIVMR